eukprot:1082638-Prymnesium_polylepis.3
MGWRRLPVAGTLPNRVENSDPGDRDRNSEQAEQQHSTLNAETTAQHHMLRQQFWNSPHLLGRDIDSIPRVPGRC